MRIIDAARVHAALDYAPLVDRLAAMFRQGCEAPVRHHHTVRTAGADAVLLLMPAWQPGRHIGVKIVSVFPDNAAQGLPAVQGVYLLSDARTGRPVALIDGPSITVRRTAAASALASRYLSRQDASRLVMVGTGALAPHLIGAHCAVRPIREVLVWGRDAQKARALAESLAGRPYSVRPADDLEAAIRQADIVSSATLSKEPLVRGAWLKPGSHVDLVGAYTPEMRESDDEAVRRARVFVDTRAGATKEGGDVVQPLNAGVLKPADILADLFELTRGEKPGRTRPDEITLFKSVGTALEDLAAAELAVERSPE
ncbi:MAG: ornithine cyclodeaminase family protein [Alphaproteobacteria bacterium]|nr:ornithine cyclodeaminase family protein [Alphaproteobacteria bacterium]